MVNSEGIVGIVTRIPHRRGMIDLRDKNYTPGRLLDFIMRDQKLRTDSQLAERIGISRTEISKIRSRKRAVTCGFLINVHLKINLAITDMLSLASIQPESLFGGHYDK